MAERASLTLKKKLLFGTIVTLTFLISSELVVRGWVYYLRENYERYDITTQTFDLVPGVHRARSHDVIVNSDGFTGPELEAQGSDLWRIVTVGDSNTFGGGSEHHTYPAYLNSLLDAFENDDHRFEVVNAAIEGLDSTHALRRLRTKVLALQPDVVTIYIGWNDLMKFDPLGQSDGGGGFSSASRGIDRLWLVKGMRKLFFIYLRPYFDPPRTGEAGRSGRFKEFDPSIYHANLTEMIREIRQVGAKPVLATLPTVVREDNTPAELQKMRVFFPFYRSGYGVGDLLDLLASYNRTVRRVAAEQRVPVADLSGLFEARPDYRSLFYDTMHPNDHGRKLIANYLLKFMIRRGLLGDLPDLDPSNQVNPAKSAPSP